MLLAVASAASAADELMNALPLARYAPMMQRSPFAIATAPPVSLPPDGNLAKHWYIARIEWARDNEIVTIRSTADPNFELTVNTKEPVNGISISATECDERPTSRADSRNEKEKK